MNLWSEENLENCHFWCCPECPFKCKTKELLIHHGLLTHPLARKTLQQKPKMAKIQFPIPLENSRKIEKRFWDFGFKENQEIVQCYHCGKMLPRVEMFSHIENLHEKFYSHMCGPPRQFQVYFTQKIKFKIGQK